MFQAVQILNYTLILTNFLLFYALTTAKTILFEFVIRIIIFINFCNIIVHCNLKLLS